MTPFTQPSMPDRRKLDKYLDGIYQSKWLTNNGPLVRELTVRLEEYLGVENLLLVSSGTMGLQIAYRALGISGPSNDGQTEVITTPFTFVATESSLRWEGLRPKFADIRPDTFNLCPEKSAELITANTRAVLPVHVYGNPCDIDAFDEISTNSDSKLVYDAAHAFGVRVNGRSVLSSGDASVLSFHATKVFHTVEGGGVVFKDPDALSRAHASFTLLTRRVCRHRSCNRSGMSQLRKMRRICRSFLKRPTGEIDVNRHSMRQMFRRVAIFHPASAAMMRLLKRPLPDRCPSEFCVCLCTILSRKTRLTKRLLLLPARFDHGRVWTRSPHES